MDEARVHRGGLQPLDWPHGSAEFKSANRVTGIQTHRNKKRKKERQKETEKEGKKERKQAIPSLIVKEDISYQDAWKDHLRLVHLWRFYQHSLNPINKGVETTAPVLFYQIVLLEFLP